MAMRSSLSQTSVDFQCCGAIGRSDWISNRIPVSCCHIDFGTVSPFECTLANANTEGCAAVLGVWLGDTAFVLGVVAATVTALQVLLTAGAGWSAYRSKFEEVTLES